MKIVAPEGATPIEPDEAEGLIPSHLATHEELDEWESRNILRAVKWAQSRRRTRVLTTTFTRELHRRMFDRTWEWAGVFRHTDKNLGVAWEQISVEVRKSLDDATLWLTSSEWGVKESAVRLHHRLVAVHPFVNGNGRHARLLADVVLFNREQPPIDWGGHALELEAAGAARSRYIQALQSADKGDYEPLLEFAGV